MAVRLLEIDNEIGAALSATNGIISLLECGKQREAFREVGGLLQNMNVFVLMSDCSEVVLPANFERAMSLITSAKESESWLLLADILRYELQPILNTWKSEFRT